MNIRTFLVAMLAVSTVVVIIALLMYAPLLTLLVALATGAVAAVFIFVPSIGDRIASIRARFTRGGGPPGDQGQGGGDSDSDGDATRDIDQEQCAREDIVSRRLFWLYVIIAHVALFAPAFLVGPWEFTLFGTTFTVSLAYVSLFLAIVLNAHPSAWGSVDEADVAGKYLFGRLMYQLSPGAVYLFWGFATFKAESRQRKNREIPGDLPELYQNSDQSQVLRMTSAPARADDTIGKDELEVLGLDPLQTGRLTLEATIPVRFQLDSRPGAYRQWVREVGTEAALLRLVDDEVVTFVRQEVVRNTPSEIFIEWAALQQRAQERVNVIMRKCGIRDLRVTIKQFDLPHSVNSALAARTAAHTNIGTEHMTGMGKKLRQELEAKGLEALTAAPVRAYVNELAAAMRSRRGGGLELKSEQALMFAWMQTIGSALENAQYSFVPQPGGGMFDPMSFMAMVQEGMKASKQDAGTPGTTGTSGGSST